MHIWWKHCSVEIAHFLLNEQDYREYRYLRIKHGLPRNPYFCQQNIKNYAAKQFETSFVNNLVVHNYTRIHRFLRNIQKEILQAKTPTDNIDKPQPPAKKIEASNPSREKEANRS